MENIAVIKNRYKYFLNINLSVIHTVQKPTVREGVTLDVPAAPLLTRGPLQKTKKSAYILSESAKVQMLNR